jgi:hypothetical protein
MKFEEDSKHKEVKQRISQLLLISELKNSL